MTKIKDDRVRDIWKRSHNPIPQQMVIALQDADKPALEQMLRVYDRKIRRVTRDITEVNNSLNYFIDELKAGRIEYNDDLKETMNELDKKKNELLEIKQQYSTVCKRIRELIELEKTRIAERNIKVRNSSELRQQAYKLACKINRLKRIRDHLIYVIENKVEGEFESYKSKAKLKQVEREIEQTIKEHKAIYKGRIEKEVWEKEKDTLLYPELYENVNVEFEITSHPDQDEYEGGSDEKSTPIEFVVNIDDYHASGSYQYFMDKAEKHLKDIKRKGVNRKNLYDNWEYYMPSGSVISGSFEDIDQQE